MKLLRRRFASGGARGSSEHSRMNLWKQATLYVSELPVTGTVQARTGWAASRREKELVLRVRGWALPRLVHSSSYTQPWRWPVLSFGSSYSQLNPASKMSQDLQLREMSATISDLIRVHSLLLGSAFREKPHWLFLFLFPLPPAHQTYLPSSSFPAGCTAP